MGIDFATLPEEDRNCIYLYLTHETWRSRIENRDVLPTFVSYFRAAMAEHRGDPAWKTNWRAFSPPRRRFEALWHQRYEVRGVENQIKHFNHPQLGRFSLQQMYWYSAPGATARACWSTCRWTRRASRRWRGWTNINHKESDGWHVPSSVCPAGAAGPSPSRSRVEGKTLPGSLLCYLWLQRNCAPGWSSALCHSWGRGGAHGRPVRRRPRPQSGHITAARYLRLLLRASVGPRHRSVQNTALSPHPCGLPHLPGTSQ